MNAEETKSDSLALKLMAGIVGLPLRTAKEMTKELSKKEPEKKSGKSGKLSVAEAARVPMTDAQVTNGGLRGIIEPAPDPLFFVRPEHASLLEVINEMSADRPQNVMMVGPQGCGKTELAMWFAGTYKRPLIIMNCATIRESKDWFGYKDAKDGTIYWHKSDFVRALEMGNAVVLLDEFNRLHTTLHNSLYPLLDARRASFVEELEAIVKVGPGTVFFSTANIGLAHVGTFTMDSAMEDRWGIRIDVSFLSEEEETKVIMSKTGVTKDLAGKLARLAADVRRKSDGIGATLSKAISTRQLLLAAELMKALHAKGKPMVSALDFCIVPFYTKDGGKDSEQAQILQLVQGIFGKAK